MVDKKGALIAVFITVANIDSRDPDRIIEELATIDEEFVFFADDESLVDAEIYRPRFIRVPWDSIHELAAKAATSVYSPYHIRAVA